jgi:hypothetical protein
MRDCLFSRRVVIVAAYALSAQARLGSVEALACHP